MAQRSRGADAQKKETKSKIVEFPKESKKSSKKKGVIDYTFLFIVVLLVTAGMVMLLSASTPAARTKDGN